MACQGVTGIPHFACCEQTQPDETGMYIQARLGRSGGVTLQEALGYRDEFYNFITNLEYPDFAAPGFLNNYLWRNNYLSGYEWALEFTGGDPPGVGRCPGVELAGQYFQFTAGTVISVGEGVSGKFVSFIGRKFIVNRFAGAGVCTLESLGALTRNEACVDWEYDMGASQPPQSGGVQTVISIDTPFISDQTVTEAWTNNTDIGVYNRAYINPAGNTTLPPPCNPAP